MKSVLFDLDGTLTDSGPGITNCIQHALRELGHDAPAADQLRWCIGPPLIGSFASLMATDDRALLDQAVTHYRSRFATVGYMENTVYDGVLDVLRDLRRLGYRTLVTTSKPEVYARRIVEHFAMDGLFDGIYGSELGGARSDKGELIAHVMEAERLPPAATIMVGDREHDVIGARRCGLACIGVSYGYGTADELRTSGAVDLAAHPDEIPILVHRHIGVP